MTTFGITTRVLITTISNYYLIAQPPPIGFGFPYSAAFAFLPFSALFNATAGTPNSTFGACNFNRRYLRFENKIRRESKIRILRIQPVP